MTLRHLKIFVSVYKNESITRASEELNIVQPSVSLAIRELERHYNVCLFDRMSRRIYRTKAADRLYTYAIHIVSLFEEAESELREWDIHSPINVGTSITIGNFILPELIKLYESTYEGIRINAIVKNTETIEKSIMDNLIDIGLIEGKINNDNIEVIPFADDRLCLIAGKESKLINKRCVSVEEIAEENLLLREPGSAGRDIVEGIFESRNIKITPRMESVSTQAIVRSVMKNIGVAILPYMLVKENIESGEVVEISVRELNLNRHFSIIYHKNKYIPESVNNFISMCRDYSNKI